MKNTSVFGTDGIRCRMGEYPMTPEFVLKLGWAFGRVLNESGRSHVLIGKDTRISGYLFESALQAGLSAAGIDIRLLGPMPTPAVAYLTQTLHASAGIVISASHNPHYDNGIKFFGANGRKLSEVLQNRIEATMQQPLTTVDSAALGKAERVKDAAGRYIEFCKSSVPLQTDFSGMHIVVDSAHGAAYHIARHVFEELGARVTSIGDQPDGLNINDGYGATQPKRLQEAVRAQHADLGVALDGDADRIQMVDHGGELLDGDDVLYILARQLTAEGRKPDVLTGTLMSNIGLEQYCRAQDIVFERTAVGDRYVVEAMERNGGIIGGEPSGHILCMHKTSTGDGIIAALQVIHAMQQQGQSLRTLKSGWVRAPQHMVNVPLPKGYDLHEDEPLQTALQACSDALADSGRVVLRPSGTEPLVRVMVEAATPDQAQFHAKKLAALIPQN